MYQAPNVDSQFSNAAFVSSSTKGSDSSTQHYEAIGDQFRIEQQQQQDQLGQFQKLEDRGAREAPATTESVSFTFDEIDAIINSKDFQNLARNDNKQQQQPQQEFVYEQQVLQQHQQQNLDGYVYTPSSSNSNSCQVSPSANRYNFATNRHQTNIGEYEFTSSEDIDDDQQLKESIYEEIRDSLCISSSSNNNNNNNNNNFNCNMATNNNNNNNANLTSKNYLANAFDNKSRPYVEIVEQPAKCSLRFRYKCEGRSAGSLPGVSSTLDNKTFPSIRISNYVGRAVVVISCVTRDAPYRAHPHNIVGKEGCKKGICTIVINNEPNMVRTFSSLGIQCVKRKDIEESLALRESINVDPFRNGFSHKQSASTIDLNVVRLCFQVFIEGTTPNKCDVPLTPIVSEPIHDKKAMSDLVITKLSHCSAPATGGREVILLCDRISKDDTQIRFYEERDGKLIWETYSELSPADVHKQVAICFKTPKYYNENISQPVMVRVQLKRLSDNQVSEPRLFQFLPCESDEDIISRKRQKIEWVNMNHYALDNILQPAQARHQPYVAAAAAAAAAAGSVAMPPAPLIHAAHQGQDLQLKGCMNAHQQYLDHRHNNQQQKQQQQQQHQSNQGLLAEASRSPMQQRSSPVPFGQQQQSAQLAAPNARAGGPGSSQASPRPSPSPTNQAQQQALHQDAPFMIDSTQNLVVRREIIDDEGKVMRLVDRPACQQMEVSNAAAAPSKPLASSLDRIDTAELMRDMTFNSNIDLNLGSSFSIHLNGADVLQQQLQQMDHQTPTQQGSTSARQREISCNSNNNNTKNC